MKLSWFAKYGATAQEIGFCRNRRAVLQAEPVKVGPKNETSAKAACRGLFVA